MAPANRLPATFNISYIPTDYATTENWELATTKNLAGVGEVAYMEDGVHDCAINFAGATGLSSTTFRVLMKDPQADSVIINYTGTTANVALLNEDYAGLYNISITGCNNIVGSTAPIYALNKITRVVGCTVYDITHASSNRHGFYASGSNNIFVNCVARGVKNTGFYVISNNPTFYNCTSYGNGQYGFYCGAVTPVAKNCISEQNTTAQWGGAGWIKTTCTDNSGVIFNDPPTDLSLDGIDTVAKETGTDLSSDPFFDFDDDAIKVSRTDPWSMGAYEYIVIPINKISQFNKNMPKSGGTFTGNVYMGAHTISGTGDIYANKFYGDGSSLTGISFPPTISGTSLYIDNNSIINGELTTVSGVYNIGDGNSDGSWRFRKTPTSLYLEQRDSGVWNNVVETVSSGIISGIADDRTVVIMLFDYDTAVTTGDGKFYFPVPSILNNKYLKDVDLHVTTVSSSGAVTVATRKRAIINDATNDVCSTDPSLAVSKRDTNQAGCTKATINITYNQVKTGDELISDVDAAGTDTKGLSVLYTFSCIQIT